MFCFLSGITASQRNKQQRSSSQKNLMKHNLDDEDEEDLMAHIAKQIPPSKRTSNDQLDDESNGKRRSKKISKQDYEAAESDYEEE